MRQPPVLLVLILLAAWPAAAAIAADGGPAAMARADVQATDATLSRIEDALRGPDAPGEEKLQAFLAEIPEARDFASQCVSDNQAALATVVKKLEMLGKINSAEAVDVAQQRTRLQERKTGIERQLQICRVLRLRAQELQTRITDLQQQRLAERLMQRDRAGWTIIGENLSHPGRWWNTAKLFLLRDSGLDALSLIELTVLAGIILVGIGGSLYAATPMFAAARRMRGGPSMAAGFAQALVSGAAHTLPLLVTSVAAAIYLTAIRSGEGGWPFITLLSYGLAGYFVFGFLLRVILTPVPPAHSYLPAPEGLLRSLASRLRTLAVLVLLVALLSATLVVEGFPVPVQRLLRLIFATILVIDLIWIIWLAGDLLKWRETHLPRLFLVAGMFGALFAEWIGYLNLAEYLVGGIVGTLVSFGLAWFVWRLLADFYDGLDAGRRHWHRRVRRALGVASDRYMPGLIWLRVLTAVAIWGAFGLLVLLMWGLSDTGLAWLQNLVYEGFSIGNFQVVPIELLWGVVVLIVLIGLTGWLKQRLAQHWLERTRMERGAREAIVTISGYVGVSIAILVGLAIAGVEFTNIALIAGALSVGIGFGLQNIFNNFVSGLILLLERPVKTNDWVVVGQTEGLIKKISIRSTQIQTFDHADVIVPNSELIQSQVTNWMLRDPFGRVIVPIRVAYGTELAPVREILLGLAHDHPRVIDDAVLAPPPEVLLRRFGDDGFEFELRMFIRDIDYVLSVQSEIYFGVDRAFREHGIAVPYPRQDIRIDRTPDPWSHPSRRRPPPPPPPSSGTPDDMGDDMGDGDGGGGG